MCREEESVVVVSFLRRTREREEVELLGLTGLLEVKLGTEELLGAEGTVLLVAFVSKRKSSCVSWLERLVSWLERTELPSHEPLVRES